MSQKITFSVNGIKKSIEIDGWEKLLYILRDRLTFTGAKHGCDDASCGACVVVVNGEAVKSCIYPARKLKGAEIITIEGLSNGKTLAVQCGFCTPGIIMELFALFNKNLDASEEEILEVLNKHLCRCTGYETILEGAKLAQKYLKENNK